MKNPTLDQIKTTVVATFRDRYGHCGVVDSANFALINSGAEDENLLVTLQDDDPKKTPSKKISPAWPALDESDRQAILLAIAELSLSRPGWKFMLKRIAQKLDGAQMFEGFRETSGDRIKPL